MKINYYQDCHNQTKNNCCLSQHGKVWELIVCDGDFINNIDVDFLTDYSYIIEDLLNNYEENSKEFKHYKKLMNKVKKSGFKIWFANDEFYGILNVKLNSMYSWSNDWSFTTEEMLENFVKEIEFLI